MLKINNVSKAFANERILDKACMIANPGVLTIVEGQNGAGKSTLFNIIVGLVHHDEGEILLGDIDFSLMPAAKRALHVAILKQDPKTSSVITLSVLENCELALLKEQKATLGVATSRKVKERVATHLLELELDFFRDFERPMNDFSGGQRQILAFAMATICRPRLLLLDEPTAALDEKSSHQLMKLVKQMIKKWQIPAVLISHDHALNQQYGDNIWVLADKKITKIK